MAAVSVRYIVDDVDAAIAFYTERLGFTVERHPAPGFAMLARGDLRLLVNEVGGPGGATQPMPDGRRPEPGGWNRIQLSVDDLDREAEVLRQAGVQFRNDGIAVPNVPIVNKHKQFQYLKLAIAIGTSPPFCPNRSQQVPIGPKTP